MLTLLRAAFAEMAEMPDFIVDAVAQNGIPRRSVVINKGNRIIRELSVVSPAVLVTLCESMKR